MIILITERWINSEQDIQIEHDGKFGLYGPFKGLPLHAIRQQLIQQEVQEQVEVKPFVLRQYFQHQGNFEDAARVNQVDFSTFRIRGGRLVTEISFVGTSFLEGFLSVYGIEMERAVKKYEEKLHLFETIDHDKKQQALFVGRLKDGEVKQLSPTFQTEQQAQHYLAQRQNRAPQPLLTVEREESKTNE